MNKTGILIIEDDKAIKNLIATTLEMHDYHYMWADKGGAGNPERGFPAARYYTAGPGAA